jgi:DNA-binding FrmR family transcriptional regulator
MGKAHQAAVHQVDSAEAVSSHQTGGLKGNMMIQTKNPEVKAQIKNRLSRIEGQLRGVQKMIDEDRDCKAIIQQLIAIRAGVHSASIKFMQDVANDCLLNTDENSDTQKNQVADLIQILGKLS